MKAFIKKVFTLFLLWLLLSLIAYMFASQMSFIDVMSHGSVIITLTAITVIAIIKSLLKAK